ncbi:MAG: type II toxin-antitoxin system HicB family antitoxin [Patescibacteria group bacterium]
MKASRKQPASLTVEFDREEDGRWIAEIARLPGVLAYGATKGEALRRVSAIALRTLADTVETGKSMPTPVSRLFEHGMASR